MLKEYLKKVFATSEQEAAPEAQATTQEDEVMNLKTNQQTDNTVAELVAKLSEANTNLSTVKIAMETMRGELETVRAAMNSLATEKAALLAAAETAKLMARKNQIVAAVGTSQADAVMAATSTLDDVSFGAVLSAFAASFEQEAKSKMFTEAGVNNEVAPVEDDVAKRLVAKMNINQQ